MGWGMAVAGGLSLAGGYMSQRRAAREMRRMRREMRRAREQMEKQLEFAQEQYARHREIYGDVERQMVADAMHGVQVDYDARAQRAGRDVASNFEGQREEQRRREAAMGLDPSSGRARMGMSERGADQALATALTTNVVREQERQAAQQQTRQDRQQIGRHGAQHIQQSANQIGQARQGIASIDKAMADMHGNMGQAHQSMANNMFANAGTMATYGAAMAGGGDGGGGGGVATNSAGNAPTTDNFLSGAAASSGANPGGAQPQFNPGSFQGLNMQNDNRFNMQAGMPNSQGLSTHQFNMR